MPSKTTSYKGTSKRPTLSLRTHERLPKCPLHGHGRSVTSLQQVLRLRVMLQVVHKARADGGNDRTTSNIQNILNNYKQDFNPKVPGSREHQVLSPCHRHVNDEVFAMTPLTPLRHPQTHNTTLPQKPVTLMTWTEPWRQCLRHVHCEQTSVAVGACCCITCSTQTRGDSLLASSPLLALESGAGALDVVDQQLLAVVKQLRKVSQRATMLRKRSSIM